MRHARIVEEINRHQWAITPAAMEAILRIVTVGEELEERSIFHGSPLSVEERQLDMEANLPISADSEPYNYGQRFENIGLINIDGPLIPRNAGQAPSQPKLTTIQGLQADFARMEADPRIDRIALIADSPGGAVTGTSEFAAQIMESEKPVVTFAEGLLASAMYWIASASDAIVGADTSYAGSVGVVAKVATKEKDKIQIVSSQSELKAADPETDEGKAVFQRMVDDTADVFVNAVAANRNTTREDVLENFGKGTVMIASRALVKGMIDAVMTRAQFMREFSGDLGAASFFSTGKSRKRRRKYNSANMVAECEKVDISTSDVELKDIDTAPEQAVKNPNEGAKPMDLKQFLDENDAARSEYADAIAQAETAACDCLRKELKEAALIATSDEYPSPVKAIAVAVIAGERSFDTLQACMTVAEMESEKKNSQAAKDKTEEIGETRSENQSERSTDGKIRTNADYLAAIGKKEEIE